MSEPEAKVHLKRVYEPRAEEDGFRVLVDRLWPRGINKEDVDLWLKEVAPSDPLRKRFQQKPTGWTEFVTSYAKELDEEPTVTAARSLRERIGTTDKVTLLFAAQDEAHNNAVVLRDWLLAH